MVSLNFDDGYLSSYSQAFPSLEKWGMKGVFYIITGAVSHGISLYMNSDMILELSEHGHEIGAHSRSHPHLPEIPRAEARLEIQGAKSELQDLGIDVSTFAYPFGEYNAEVRNIVQESGYSGARSVEPGFNDASSDRFLLKRFSVEQGVTVEEIRARIDEAEKKNVWLILVFHRIEENEGPFSSSPALLDEILDYLSRRDSRVVTNKEGLESLSGSRSVY